MITNRLIALEDTGVQLMLGEIEPGAKSVVPNIRLPIFKYNTTLEPGGAPPDLLGNGYGATMPGDRYAAYEQYRALLWAYSESNLSSPKRGETLVFNLFLVGEATAVRGWLKVYGTMHVKHGGQFAPHFYRYALQATEYEPFERKS